MVDGTRKRTTLWWAGMLLVGAAAGFFISEYTQVSHSDGEQELEALQQELAELRQEVRSAAHSPPSYGTNSQPVQPRSTVGTSDENQGSVQQEQHEPLPPSPDELRAQAEYDGRRRDRALAVLAEEGPPDFETQEAMRNALGGAGVGSIHVQSARCSSRVCEFEITHAEPDAAREAAYSLWTHPLFRGAPSFIRREEGVDHDGYVSRLFVGRNGFSLPDVASL